MSVRKEGERNEERKKGRYLKTSILIVYETGCETTT